MMSTQTGSMDMLRRLVVLVGLALVLGLGGVPVGAAPASPAPLPEAEWTPTPRVMPEAEDPLPAPSASARPGTLYDDGRMFSSDTRKIVRARLDAIRRTYDRTVWIITVPTLRGHTFQEALDEYTSGKNPVRGLAIVIARDERRLGVSAGSEARSMLGGQRARDLKQGLLRAFRQGQFDSGILAALDAIEGYLKAGR